MDISSQYLMEMAARWLHVLAGIVWVGLLYFFNLVNIHFNRSLDKDIRSLIVPKLMGRALFFFRWGSMFTFLLGLSLLYFVYLQPGHARQLASPPGYWILTGMGLGTIMWVNVWFVIWPCQKKIIQGIKSGLPPSTRLAKLSENTSKLNTYFSVPLVFCMLAGPHFPFFIVSGVLMVFGFSAGLTWFLLRLSARIAD